MAFRIVASLLAEGVALDGFTDRLTAFNMLETVYSPSFPAVLGKLVVINVYEIEDGHMAQWERVTVLDGTGQQLGQVVTELAGEGGAFRSMAMFQGLKLEKPGVYRVVVEGARRRDGPWEQLQHRRLHAQLRPHPLARSGEANPDAGKITGPVAITD